MSASRLLLSRLGASRRATLGLALLGTIAIVALFADVLASGRPIVRLSDRGVEVFPRAVLDESSFPKDEEGVRPEGGDAAPRWELWPYCRYGPRTETRAILQPASLLHPLGTDERGRDVFARLIHGARVTLLTGLSVVLIGAIGGVFAGGLAGGFGKRYGKALERLTQSVDVFPAIIVVALFRAVEGEASALSAIVGASLFQWATVARLVRSEVERLAAEDFVLASRALGATRREVLTRHVLPHLGPTLAASAALGLSAVVVLESTLSFLGLGAPISSASWGEMMAEGARNPQQLGLFWAPLVLLSLTVGSAYLIAEAVRSVSDPRTTHRDAPAVADRA